MPRIPQSEVKQDELYGVRKVDTGLSFRDRCKKLFRAGDTVRVHNPTNVPVKWQWLDEQDEDYTIEDETNIKITDRGTPELWELGAGEYDVLTGACAIMMLDTLYKQICTMKIGIVINPLSENEIRNFSMDDPEKQDQFLEVAFIGKVSPQDMTAAAIQSLGKEEGARVDHGYKLPSLITPQEERAKRQANQSAMNSRPSVPQGPRELADLADEFDAGETLLGTATGGLPTDDKRPVTEPEPEDPKPKPAAAKPAKKKEPVGA